MSSKKASYVLKYVRYGKEQSKGTFFFYTKIQFSTKKKEINIELFSLAYLERYRQFF